VTYSVRYAEATMRLERESTTKMKTKARTAAERERERERERENFLNGLLVLTLNLLGCSLKIK
jgi:hypothetical protein